jgi:UDP-glucose 4-epimerase
MAHRVLITGGFGYLGGRLSQFLSSQGNYEVLLGSRNQTQSPSWLPTASVVQTQWDSIPSLLKVCSGVKTIVHLAGMNAENCSVDPATALEVNAVSTTRFLQVAIRQGVKRFIYLSTAHVYGSPLMGVITEETLPVPTHPYAYSHRAGEDAVLSAHHKGLIDGVVIRLSNSFGVPADKDANCWMLLVNDLCRQAVSLGKIVLHSRGMQKRDFIPLHDVTRAIKHVIEWPEQEFGCGPFNLGGEASYRIIDLAEFTATRCEAVLGYRPEIERQESAHDEESLELTYCIDKLKKTGFILNGKMENEIDATLVFCQKAFRETS